MCSELWCGWPEPHSQLLALICPEAGAQVGCKGPVHSCTDLDLRQASKTGPKALLGSAGPSPCCEESTKVRQSSRILLLSCKFELLMLQQSYSAILQKLRGKETQDATTGFPGTLCRSHRLFYVAMTKIP